MLGRQADVVRGTENALDRIAVGVPEGTALQY
jgi:hypothetical protein